MKNLVIGVDIAKRVFQLHWVEKSGEIKSVQLRREKFLEHFANRAPCLVGMEACGGWSSRSNELAIGRSSI
jgi:transposase